MSKRTQVIDKKCSCGRIYTSIPSVARYLGSGDELAGWYWNCACRSTLFVPEDRP